ncbi:SNF1-interacting protein [Sporothrix stenoceras]|uniref:SNF1-interacting protein n=1 Tax=Sporothrix stenoceras TaxID=5173 RepID=A0ABR3Z767_9PEZI
MGNTSTKESRPGQSGVPGDHGQSSSLQQPHGTRSHGHGSSSSRARGRSGRGNDLGSLLGISAQGSSGTQDPPRRESRQEREARRLERERQARLVERERSMREEHVDGGYLVTLGTYVGPEDFSKPTVRMLQIERRLAPFWRGLQDVSPTWTEYQIAAAARGLDVPPPDQPPPESFFSRPPTSAGPPGSASPPKSATGNTLTVPGANASSTQLATPSSSTLSGAIPTGSLAGTSSPAVVIPPSPTTAGGATTPRGGSSSSPFKPRAKALAAALSISSRNGSSTDIAPREIMLPHDPYVNGQPIEVYLYKNADECPICFLSYPPYLNKTRCCDQAICSECFVQIKRADPHYPENHGDNNNGGEGGANANGEENQGKLVSEPACCPYCQQPEFGVTYDPPPFRRGLVHASSSMTGGIGAMHSAAMSSNSSINSPTSLLSPNSGSPPAGGAATPVSRRRAQSLSANAPNVVTTDRVRPDWSTKLASQTAHIARRAAAATALHTAAFIMGGNQDNRTFRVSRFNRRNASSNNVAGDASPVPSGGDGATGAPAGTASAGPEGPRTTSNPAGTTNGTAGPSSERRTRMEDLEELMFREALRQSLATEEERRRKSEKEERKDAKRREKEERKAAKQMAKRTTGTSSSLYTTGTDSGHSSASASSLSLSGLGSNLGSGLGISSRRRGNSGASNLRVEASVANAMAVSGSGSAGNGNGQSSGQDTAATGSPASSGGTSPVIGNAPSGPTSPTLDSSSTAQDSASTTTGKGKAVDRSGPLASTPETDADTEEPAQSSSTTTTTTTTTSAPRPIPSPQHPSAGPSHLRQMSSASSVSSSLPDSTGGSFPNSTNPLHLQDPRASGLSLGSRSGASDDGDHHHDDTDPATSAEPLFNFGSLAAVVGVQLEGKNAGRRLSVINREEQEQQEIATSSSPPKDSESINGHVEHAEHGDAEHGDAETTETIAADSSSLKQPVPLATKTDFKQTPEVLITPGTPAPTDDFE